ETIKTASLIIIKNESLIPLIEEMAEKIGELNLLANQCNEQKVKIDCGGIRNPCYRKCDPENPCVIVCRSENLQTGGGCYGEVCPRDEIESTVNRIKELEDQIFIILKEIKELLNISPYLLGQEKEFIEVEGEKKLIRYPYNLEIVRGGISICAASPEYPLWEVFSCEQARYAIGPDGDYILNCNPNNFFCCGYTEEPMPIPTEQEVITRIEREIATKADVIPRKDNYDVSNYEAISEGNCPLGWECNQDILNPPQYQDASVPLKQLLTCMRDYLDAYQANQEANNNVLVGLNKYGKIGRISSITDSKLYSGLCDWITGSGRNCSHKFVYSPTSETGTRVSDHYGGPKCRYDKQSYAVDIGLARANEKNHAIIIERAAKACEPNAYVEYGTDGHKNHMHIQIGRIYGCR
ncbi:MAG: hypothetical protein PHN37_02910, partial [Candidatus Pacebacteria bacterium]|nr:hypothetical protein [Candidatus Paceibacterota bacterium]